MSSGTRHSTRLVLDLQACQTQGSANRGVGRYSTGFAAGLLCAGSELDMRAILSEGLPHRPRDIPIGAERIAWLPQLPEWQTDRDFAGGERDSLDAVAYTALAQRLKPDVLHVSHVFEGLGDRVPLPDLSCRASGQIVSATLYDLIPLVQQAHYFAIPGLRPWYLARTSWLRGADLLLAISESTRNDAIELLGIDPWRVVTIHGGVGPQFTPGDDRAGALRHLRTRHAIGERYVLYTGGDDHRKNIQGAIEGFAAVPKTIRDGIQLVIVCAMAEPRRQHFMDVARRSGLGPADVLVTGFVQEDDLVAFYRACELFVFPSLYEGLGLPVLEAMACGAPAIGSDNSSIREIVGRKDAMFDGATPASVAERIASVLRDDGLRESLRRHGAARAAEYTWSRTAARALDAWSEALERARTSGVSSAVHGWLPRKRLAVHSPLPPLRSGIADYNAEFLPALARHFDIDLYTDGQAVDDALLNASFRVFDVRDFERVAASYDAILYEFGNSAFHVLMPALLERFPGVVGLHDAYLSGLFRYMATVRGHPEEYRAEMLRAHGPRARRLLAPCQGLPDPDETAMVELPCTKRVLERALGVISHSPFNLAVARECFPESWPGPYRTIPQMVATPVVSSERSREAARRALGFGAADFVIATFGHVAWTKWGDLLLEGFLRSSLRDDAAARLVFAGELASDAWGADLARAVRASGLGDRVRITGYLSSDDYEAHVMASDVAVQLRTKSRGGTPSGVLDCLVRGVPVIVNNEASYTDYPDDVVIKLPATPEPRDIAGMLDRCREDPAWLRRQAETGRDYVSRHHSAARCAAEYAAAIEAFVARDRLAGTQPWIAAFAPHLAGTRDPDGAVAMAAEWLHALPRPSFDRRRILVDVSHIVHTDHQTGVPRVVRRIVRAMMCTARAGIEPIAVALEEGRLVVPRDWLAAEGLLLPHERDAPVRTIEPAAGDVLLMLDSSWGRHSEFQPVFERARAVRARIVTAIYDLLPIVLPPGNIVEGGKEWFEAWFRDAAAWSDGLVCISRTVADDVRDYLETHALARPGLTVGHWHLGANFADFVDTEQVTPRVQAATAAPYLVMVGTIEPRKCHARALDAMERLWERGETLRLVVTGKEGWMVGDLMERLRSHPRLGKELFLVEQPSDPEVATLYDRAAGLLFLSRGEGFGLPLVEAASHGTPILCSDLPVFHEVAGDFATYVADGDADLLAAAIGSWWERRRANAVPDTRAMPMLSWEQSTEALLRVVADGEWYWTAEDRPGSRPR